MQIWVFPLHVLQHLRPRLHRPGVRRRNVQIPLLLPLIICCISVCLILIQKVSQLGNRVVAKCRNCQKSSKQNESFHKCFHGCHFLSQYGQLLYVKTFLNIALCSQNQNGTVLG